MAIISNVRNDGNPAVNTGPKFVNSYNVKPTQIVAVASPNGYKFGPNDIANYDFFNAVQTSANTDQIVLLTSLPVGCEVQFYCVSICKVVPVSTDTVTINAGTAAQGITLAVGSVYFFEKTSATTWVCAATAASGAITAPVPA